MRRQIFVGIELPMLKPPCSKSFKTMPMGYQGSSSSISKIEYKVAATGDTWFQPKIASSDSADYTADKTEAVAQCAVLSPNGVESVA